MNESKLRAEVGAALRRLWYHTYTNVDMTRCDVCGNEKFPTGGFPDMILWDWRGPFGAIEFKVFPAPTHGGWARTSFSLSKISPAQRAWMLYAQETGACHLYIGLGTVHGRAGAKDEPRLAWVIPWAIWQKAEDELMKPFIQKSLPLTLRPGLRREVQDCSLVATELFKAYELKWRKGGWEFLMGHPIYQARPLQYSLSPRDLKAMRTRQAEIREEQKEIWTTPTH